MKKGLLIVLLLVLVGCSNAKAEPKGEYVCSGIADWSIHLEITNDGARMFNDTESFKVNMVKLANSNYSFSPSESEEPVVMKFDKARDVLQFVDQESGEVTPMECTK